jgi:hypothetical protein
MMKSKIALLLSILVLSCTGIQGQSAYEIQLKYGKRVNVYSVSEALWMSPTYDSKGQLCLMRVFPKTVSTDTNYLSPDLDIDETLRFINELVPVHTRGRREEGSGISDFGGGVVWTQFNFEHVRFVFVSSFRITKMPDKKDSDFGIMDDFPFDEAAYQEYRRQEAMKSDDQLIREHVHGARVLQITWANRKCK